MGVSSQKDKTKSEARLLGPLSRGMTKTEI